MFLPVFVIKFFAAPPLLLSLLCIVLVPAGRAADDPEASKPSARLLAVGSVLHNRLDKEGETLGGFGSALACDGQTDGRYLSVSDRGPGDGTVDYRPRLQAWRIDRLPEDPARLRVILEETTILADAEGKPGTGLFPDAPDAAPSPVPRRKSGQFCLDPEGIVRAPDGTIFLSDEYGPFIYQFKRSGRLIRVLRPPVSYLPRDTDGKLDFGSQEEPAAGRMPNRGFEGLAISPDGHALTALLQSALAQDGGKDGGVTRLLVFDAEHGQPIAEYAYAMEDGAEASKRLGLEKDARLKTKNLSVCEIHAVDAHRFLVIERDNRGLDGTEDPVPAAAKSVWLVDTAGATNLLTLPSQPYTATSGLPTSSYTPLSKAVESGAVKPVEKRLLIDLVRACKESGNAAFAAGIPEKWEGLALRAADVPGRYTLLVSTDNDFLSPVLRLAGQDVPFPKTKRPLDTLFVLFEVVIPGS